MQLTGKTILIAGGTSGIGLGLALRFSAAGNRVIVAGRREEVLRDIAAEHPGIDTAVLDIADPESIAALRDALVVSHPELDVVVAMAGIMQPEDLRDPASLATAEQTVTTNLLGPIRLVSAFVQHLESRRDAVIITVTSGLAYVPLPVAPTYSATKAAMHSWTDSLRVHLADTSVQVIELAPPLVRTTLMGNQDNEHGMPLEEFLDETMSLLAAEPDARQILVERVKFLRFAEATGQYDAVLGRQSTLPG